MDLGSETVGSLRCHPHCLHALPTVELDCATAESMCVLAAVLFRTDPKGGTDAGALANIQTKLGGGEAGFNALLAFIGVAEARGFDEAGGAGLDAEVEAEVAKGAVVELGESNPCRHSVTGNQLETVFVVACTSALGGVEWSAACAADTIAALLSRAAGVSIGLAATRFVLAVLLGLAGGVDAGVGGEVTAAVTLLSTKVGIATAAPIAIRRGRAGDSRAASGQLTTIIFACSANETGLWGAARESDSAPVWTVVEQIGVETRSGRSTEYGLGWVCAAWCSAVARIDFVGARGCRVLQQGGHELGEVS